MGLNNKINIFLGIVSGLLLSALLLPAQPQQTTTKFKVVGYYSLKSAMENPKDIPFKWLTHINLWFLNPDSTGTFKEDLSPLKSFINSAHAKKVKVLFSLGGGTKQPQYKRLLQDENRAGFINALMEVVLKNNTDGVDVDLEGSDIDDHYENFVLELAPRLRSQNKLMTAAVAVYYQDQLSDKALAQYDFVNIMSYDRTGPWRPEKPGPHATFTHAVQDLDYFGSVRKMPKDKMTLGVPFYGYGYGPELTSPAISMRYSNIVLTFPGAELVDEWRMPDGKLLYYNGVPTIKQKTLLAKDLASGIMIWELGGDAPGKKSLLKAIAKTGSAK
jgi:chitinase